MSSERSGHEWDELQIAYWDALAEEYDALYSTSWSRSEDGSTKELLARVVKSEHELVILDVACGTGLGYGLVRGLGAEVRYKGIDISTKMLAACAAKYPGIDVERGSMSDLSRFQSDSVDFVMALNTSFSFAESSMSVLAEMYRVVSQQGAIFVSALNQYSLRRILSLKTDRLEHYRTRSSSEKLLSVPAWTFSRNHLLSMLKQAGFRKVSIEGQSIMGGVLEASALWRVDQCVSKWIPYACHSLNAIAWKNP